MTTRERGYGSTHQRERRRYESLVRSGDAICVRCFLSISSRAGEPCPRCGRVNCGGGKTYWDLGHDDDDRSLYTGPEHSCCNRKAGAKKGGFATAQKRRRRAWSRQWLGGDE